MAYRKRYRDTIVRACGHEEEIDIYYTKGTLDRELEREAEKNCTKCLQIQKEHEHKEKVEENAAIGFPALAGTPKQISWAEDIRNGLYHKLNSNIEDLYDTLTERIERASAKNNDVPFRERFAEFIHETRMNIDATSWLLENIRTCSHAGDIINCYKDMHIPATVYMIKDDMKSGKLLPRVTFIADTKKPGVVKIYQRDTSVEACYVYDDDFKQFMHKLGYRWKDDCYQREATAGTGDSGNLAAITATALLSEGYRVTVNGEEGILLTSHGDFEPFNDREIFYSEKYKNYVLCSNDEEVFDKAMTLPKAKDRTYYPNDEDPARYEVSVSSLFGDEVMDFALTYDFAVSTGASKAFDETRAVHLEKIMPKNYMAEHHERMTKRKDSEILDDLIDD